MPRTVTIEQHAVFVTLQDRSKYRVSDWLDWDEAISLWTAMDDQRREALQSKGLLAVARPTGWSRIKHYEVRSENDPAYRSLPEFDLVRHFRVLTREYTTQVAAAKGVLKPLGYFGKGGGWVYFTDKGQDRPLAQGWESAAHAAGHRVVEFPDEKGYRAVVTSALLVRKQQVSA